VNPKHGEIRRVNLDPTVGSEIRKTRPVVVVSSDSIRALPLRLVAPITGWQDHFKDKWWLVPLEPTKQNGLTKTSVVDTLQLRGVDVERFVEKLGTVDAHTLAEITAAIALVIEYS
jgi:mRNA interferase MazF